jgi:hypothetical protein
VLGYENERAGPWAPPVFSQAFPCRCAEAKRCAATITKFGRMKAHPTAHAPAQIGDVNAHLDGKRPGQRLADRNGLTHLLLAGWRNSPRPISDVAIVFVQETWINALSGCPAFIASPLRQSAYDLNGHAPLAFKAMGPAAFGAPIAWGCGLPADSVRIGPACDVVRREESGYARFEIGVHDHSAIEREAVLGKFGPDREGLIETPARGRPL